MVWGAFTNASSAMMAMSYDLGTISQNVANVNTTGYKDTETLFRTQLSETLASPSSDGTSRSGMGTSIFGVGAVSRTDITNQGVITPTSNANDLAIDGNGFFVVAQPDFTTGGAPATVSISDPSKVSYTRAGDFSQVAGAGGQGYYVTQTGQYVLGWMADSTGTITPGGALTPVYTMPTTVMAPVPTTTASILANIPSDVTPTPSNPTGTSTVADGNGANQTMTMTWTRTGGDTWTVTPSVDPSVGSVTSGAISVTLDSNGNIVSPTTPGAQAVSVAWGAANGNSTTTPTINLSASKPTLNFQTMSLNIYDAPVQPAAPAAQLPEEHSLQLEFECSGTDQWYLHFNSSEVGATVNTASIPVTFNADGTLATPATATPVSVTWADGQTSNVSLDLTKLTQLAGTQIQINSITQNGAASGTIVSQQFNSVGQMVGSFSNGQSRVLFQLPVATFVSENSLAPISGTLFQQTQASGPPTIQTIDQVGANTIGGSVTSGTSMFVPSALETSTADVGTDFTRMIIAQKAYSTNSAVFKVTDEMLTTVRDLQT